MSVYRLSPISTTLGGRRWRNPVLTTSSGYWLRPQAKHVKGLLQQPLSSVARRDDLRQ
jgi:hypothetical protein